MSNNYESGEMAEKGKKTECIIRSWLKRNSQVKSLIDVSHDKAFQRLDVDVIATLHDGRQIQIEIKTDYNLLVSGNFLFELQRVYMGAKTRHPSTMGWSVKTPAEYIVWYSPKKQKIVSMLTNNYRRSFMDYMTEIKANPRFHVECTSENCTTINILFPVRFLSDYVIHDNNQELDFQTPEDLNTPF